MKKGHLALGICVVLLIAVLVDREIIQVYRNPPPNPRNVNWALSIMVAMPNWAEMTPQDWEKAKWTSQQAVARRKIMRSLARLSQFPLQDIREAERQYSRLSATTNDDLQARPFLLNRYLFQMPKVGTRLSPGPGYCVANSNIDLGSWPLREDKNGHLHLDGWSCGYMGGIIPGYYDFDYCKNRYPLRTVR